MPNRRLLAGLVLLVVVGALVIMMALSLRSREPHPIVEMAGQPTPVPTARPDGLKMDVILASSDNLRNFLGGLAGQMNSNLTMSTCPGVCDFANQVQKALDPCTLVNPPVDFRTVPPFNPVVHEPILKAFESGCSILRRARDILGPPADTPQWQAVRLNVRDVVQPRAEWFAGPTPAAADSMAFYLGLRGEAVQLYFRLSAYARGCGDYLRVPYESLPRDCPTLLVDFANGMKMITDYSCVKQDVRQLQHSDAYDPRIFEPLAQAVVNTCAFLQLTRDAFGVPQDNETWHLTVKLAVEMLEPAIPAEFR